MQTFFSSDYNGIAYFLMFTVIPSGLTRSIFGVFFFGLRPRTYYMTIFTHNAEGCYHARLTQLIGVFWAQTQTYYYNVTMWGSQWEISCPGAFIDCQRGNLVLKERHCLVFSGEYPYIKCCRHYVVSSFPVLA